MADLLNYSDFDLPSDAELLESSTTAFVFAVDAGPKMFHVNNGVEAMPFLLSLQCIRQWLRNYIFDSSNCYCSIILLATKKKENPMSCENIYVVQNLKPIDVTVIKKIDELCKACEENTFEEKFGFGDFRLAETLWIASSFLLEIKRKLQKNITLFTNQENPFTNSLDMPRIFTKVEDMLKSKISFQLIPFGASFDKKLYKEILEIANSEAGEPVRTLQELLLRTPAPKRRHVPLANVPLYLSDDLFIPVTVNNLVRPVKMPFEVTLSKATNAPVTSKVTQVTQHTSDEEENQHSSVRPDANRSVSLSQERYNIVRYETLGGHDISFTLAEMDQINAIGERRIRILGFKPRSILALELHEQPSPFIYPCEKTAKGATALFTALLQSCLKKNVVAICTFCPRPTSTIRYVALAPQTEVTTGNVQVSPPGFLMIYLPFANEVRDIDEECTRKPDECASSEQVEIMKKVVKKLRFEFTPQNFPNPKLASHWANVEALALEKLEPENISDSAQPDTDRIKDRLQDLPDKFNSSVYTGDNLVPQSVPKRIKKPADSIADIETVEEHYREDTLGRLNLDQLKNYLKHVGLGTGLSKMKKADLIQSVRKYLEKNPC